MLLGISCKECPCTGKIPKDKLKVQRWRQSSLMFWSEPVTNLHQTLIPSLAVVFLAYSNTGEGLAEAAWECKLTTAQCWNHHSCGTFYYSFCGFLMKDFFTCTGFIIILRFDKWFDWLVIGSGLGCVFFCWFLVASFNSGHVVPWTLFTNHGGSISDLSST